VDGKDDDACWKEAQPLGDFVTLPSGDPPKYRTEARMAYDDKNLYLLLVAYQAKDTLWRETGGGRDDRIWCDDAVEFFVNRPDAKDKEYVQIIASAWGGIYDHYNGNPRFNADLTCKTQILDDRFVIEMAVAWASLPNIGPQDRLLRVNFQRGKRTRADYEEVSDWFPASNAQDLTARGWMVLAP
jgi:hypothetical protein